MSFSDADVRPVWRRWIEARRDRILPEDPVLRHGLRIRIFRIIAATDILLALYYFAFRYTASVNVHALWIAIPLLLAETYSFVDAVLFVFMMWRPKRRTAPPAPAGCSVDVFITTYSEPVELVRETAEAANKICYPHHTYVLDDGNRPEMRAICEELGCGYITRGKEWDNRPRHAKAGNVNNALTLTSGDFILILDSDQIPEPQILDRTLGYFDDMQVAFVQTPQYFYNVPKDDPFGSQAPLFYGPIQQGKDGWNAAFFCGSNAVLRREALLQLGLVTYVRTIEDQITRGLSHVPFDVQGKGISWRYRLAAQNVAIAAEKAMVSLRDDEPLARVLETFNNAVRACQRAIIAEDLSSIAHDLEALEGFEQAAGEVRRALEDNVAQLADDLAEALAPSPESFGLDPVLLRMLQMDTGEALDVQPLATFSITEDMATAMQLHSMGWQSVFHPEILAKGLAPEDLGSVLGQRLRWAAGTIQVLVAENPLRKAGLSWPQRLQYFTTMYSYFSGFASLVFLVAPIIFLLTGTAPVVSYADEFLWRIIPYLLVNKLMFLVISWGIDVSRGEQYSLALFPLWIQAVMTVFSGARLRFQVTPKTRQSGVYLSLVWPQLLITVLLVLSSVYAIVGLILGWRHDTIGVLVNVLWAGYDVLTLSVILRAAVYHPRQTTQARG